MDVFGKIIQVMPLQTGEGKNGTWKKQDYLLEYGDRFPKKIIFNLWGEKIDQYNLQMGENVTISFDIDAREYQGKYYTDIRAWGVTRAASAGSNQPAANNGNNQPAQIMETAEETDDFFAASSDDDLPF